MGLVTDKSSQLLKGTIFFDIRCLAAPLTPDVNVVSVQYAARRLGVSRTKFRNPLEDSMPPTLKSRGGGRATEATTIVLVVIFVVFIMYRNGLRTFVLHLSGWAPRGQPKFRRLLHSLPFVAVIMREVR